MRQTPRANWYPDPAGGAHDRWWNGQEWSDDFARTMTRLAPRTRGLLWTASVSTLAAAIWAIPEYLGVELANLDGDVNVRAAHLGLYLGLAVAAGALFFGLAAYNVKRAAARQIACVLALVVIVADLASASMLTMHLGVAVLG